MANTTLETLRNEFSARNGWTTPEQSDFATTTNIAAGATIISTNLRNAGYEDLEGATSGDDVFEGWYVIIKGTANSGVVRKLTAYDASVSQLSVSGVNLTAETVAVDFELHKHDPRWMRDALNLARRTAFKKGLWRPLIDETLFTDQGQTVYTMPTAIVGSPYEVYLVDSEQVGSDRNLFSNPDFENGATSWTATGLTALAVSGPTVPSRHRVMRGNQAIRITSTASTLGTFLQSISTPRNFSGLRLNLSAWVYCRTASRVKVRVKIDSTVTDGTGDRGIHLGSGWQKLSLSVDLEPADPTSFTLDAGVIVTSAAGQIEFYVDQLMLTAGPVGVEESSIVQRLTGWRWREWIDSDGTTTGQLVFAKAPPDRYGLRLVGKGYLSSVTADADNMEVASPHTELLYAEATLVMLHTLLAQKAVSQQAYKEHLENTRAWREEAMRFHRMPELVYANALPFPWGRA